MRIDSKDYPGTPLNRTLIAYEPDSAQIKKAFQDEPGSLWVITPTRIIERQKFFAPVVEVKTTGSVGSTP
jgi:hypothetical protein